MVNTRALTFQNFFRFHAGGDQDDATGTSSDKGVGHGHALRGKWRLSLEEIRRYTFAKVLCIVTLYGKYIRTLTFKNLCQACANAWSQKCCHGNE